MRQKWQALSIGHTQVHVGLRSALHCLVAMVVASYGAGPMLNDVPMAAAAPACCNRSAILHTAVYTEAQAMRNKMCE